MNRFSIFHLSVNKLPTSLLLPSPFYYSLSKVVWSEIQYSLFHMYSLYPILSLSFNQISIFSDIFKFEGRGWGSRKSLRVTDPPKGMLTAHPLTSLSAASIRSFPPWSYFLKGVDLGCRKWGGYQSLLTKYKKPF